MVDALNATTPASEPEPTAPLPNGSVALDRAERETLQRLIASRHVSGAVLLLGVSKTTLLAAAAGSGIRRGSAAMISRRLVELADQSTP